MINCFITHSTRPGHSLASDVPRHSPLGWCSDVPRHSSLGRGGGFQEKVTENAVVVNFLPAWLTFDQLSGRFENNRERHAPPHLIGTSLSLTASALLFLNH